jgi:hypothetical protein
MEFSTVVLLVIVAGVAYTFYKAFSKKETIAEAIKEEVAEVKAVEAKVEQEVKVVAAKAKTAAKATATKATATVKKATTRKPKATAK